MSLHLPIIDDSGNTVGDYDAAMGRGTVNVALDSTRFWIVNATGDYVQLDPSVLTATVSAVAASAPVLTDTGGTATEQTQAGTTLPLATTITSGAADTTSGALSILGAPSPVGGIPWWAVAGIALLLLAR